MPYLDLRPKPFDFDFMQGDSLRLPVRLKATNLTGCTLRGQFRKPGHPECVVTQIVSRVDVNGDGDATFMVYLPAATVSDMQGTYDYDIELVDTQGDVTKLLRGAGTFYGEATK